MEYCMTPKHCPIYCLLLSFWRYRFAYSGPYHFLWLVLQKDIKMYESAVFSTLCCGSSTILCIFRNVPLCDSCFKGDKMVVDADCSNGGSQGRQDFSLLRNLRQKWALNLCNVGGAPLQGLFFFYQSLDLIHLTNLILHTKSLWF